MSNHKPNQNKPLPQVRGKSGAKSRKLGDQLDFANAVLASAPKAALAPAVAGPLTNLAASVATAVGAAAAKVAADAAAAAAKTALIAATRDLREANSALVFAGEQACKGDPTLLAQLAVPTALPRSNQQVAATPGGDVTKLTTKPGVSSGELEAKCAAVPDAGGYIFEYKLEPSLPTDPWLPSGGAATKYTSHTFGGFAAQQLLRVRACAIGASPGAWSLEVVGRAK